LFLKKHFFIFFLEYLYLTFFCNRYIISFRLLFDVLEILSVSLFSLFFFIYFLKSSIKFKLNILIDIVIIDFFNKKLRYNVKYLLQSLKFNLKFTITFFLNEKKPLISLINLFKNANWFEREVWDMFGIYILNHFDLRRILTDYSFLQFPLRKDFPLSGFFELYYNDAKKKIILTKISFLQEFRFFFFKTIWKY